MEQRVKGEAAVGNRVTYFDMANQDGAVLIVESLPADNLVDIGGVPMSLGYGLRDVATGRTSTSDLRQHGWTFVPECRFATSDGNRDDPSFGYCGLAPAHAGSHGAWRA